MTNIATRTASSDQSKSASKARAKTTRARSTSSPHRSPRNAVTPTVLAALNVTPALAAKITKRDQLSAMLVRDEGATLDQMIASTGWLPHTTRAALTGLRKAGYIIDSDKIDGVRTYRAVGPK